MSSIIAAISPVFLVSAVGFFLRKREFLDARTLATLNIYLLIPALVFSNIYERPLNADIFLRIFAASVIMLAVMALLLTLLARLMRLQGSDASGFMMTMFPNLGNFGLPVALFSFGQEGLAIAIVTMVIGSALQNSFGLYYAKRAEHPAFKALLHVFRYPMIYAFAAALVFRHSGLHIPLGISRSVGIVSDAAVPLQMLILGIQIAETHVESTRPVFVAGAVRLVAGPALAILAVFATGLGGVAAKSFIIQMSGPVAVGMAAYGVQFNVAPRFLASVVAWTFFMSLITVAVLLYFIDLLPV